MRTFKSLESFLLSKSSNPSTDDIVQITGDAAAQWQFTGVTGQTPSQSPAQLGDALLNDANGNQWELIPEGRYLVDKFGATPSKSGEPTVDSTAQIQAAINAAQSAYSSLASYGCQSPVVELGDGAYLVTDTLTNTYGLGHWSIIAKNGRESSLVWGYAGGDTTKPVIDNVAKGENFRANNFVMTRAALSTPPYCFIKTTTGIDIGFDVGGMSFVGSSEAVIESAGGANVHLNNWRCDDTGKYILKMTADKGGDAFNRVISFTDFTFHTREDAETPMKAVVSVELSSSDQYNVVFNNNRHELEDGGMESSFCYVDASGETSSSPAITCSFKHFGCQINGSTTKEINIIESTATTNINVNVSFLNALFDQIDNFKTGNVTASSDWPDASDYSRRMINGNFISGKTDNVSSSITTIGLSHSGSASAQASILESMSVTSIVPSSGIIDISGKRGQIIVIDTSSSPVIEQINGNNGSEIIYLRGTMLAGTLVNTGNIRMPTSPINIQSTGWTALIFDLNSSTWRPVGVW